MGFIHENPMHPALDIGRMVTFRPSDKEFDDAIAFMDKHDREKHGKIDNEPRYCGAIGGGYNWSFTPTSLGNAIVIQCTCGEELNVTDYSSW
jgi:hypothetical protein